MRNRGLQYSDIVTILGSPEIVLGVKSVFFMRCLNEQKMLFLLCFVKHYQ